MTRKKNEDDEQNNYQHTSQDQESWKSEVALCLNILSK
jgi:hypothetical protein